MNNGTLDLRFHHVGLACRRLEAERKAHELLGYVAEGETFVDPVQRIRGLFMTNGGMRIELLEPAASPSPVDEILQRGQKMYHQGFLCSDIRAAVAYLEQNGARVISPPVPAVAFGGKEISFLMLRTLMIVELIER
ncbi:VOC family protein [Paenibacillus gansuensis]|uniref:VOC family protein n=1 Tax=Paenibacillus gansuensis TaxID=306542 RepID=A0ABW5PD42_9BACL